MKDYHKEKPDTCQYCHFEASENNYLQDHMIQAHAEIVILHTMAKQVDDMTDNAVSNESFKGEVMSLLKLLCNNQNEMKHAILEIRNKQAVLEEQSSNKTTQGSHASPLPTTNPSPTKTSPPAQPAGDSPPVRSPNNSSSSSKPSSGQSRTARTKMKKTAYLQKPKILYIGDSVASNVHFASLEKATKGRIKTVKAYSSVSDSKARWPAKNVTDVASKALSDCSTP